MEKKMIDGVDVQLDQMGIVLQKKILCGECNKRMVDVAPGKFRCPKCRAVFEEIGRK